MARSAKSKQSSKSRSGPAHHNARAGTKIKKAITKPASEVHLLTDAAKAKMQAIEGFPHIQPRHWRPVLCKHYKLKCIKRDDPLYHPAHMFCYNAKIKHATMAERHREAYVHKLTTKPEVKPQPPLEERVAH